MFLFLFNNLQQNFVKVREKPKIRPEIQFNGSELTQIMRRRERSSEPVGDNIPI